MNDISLLHIALIYLAVIRSSFARLLPTGRKKAKNSKWRIRQTVYSDLMAKYENPMSAMISCNDGFRPFSFYIEVIE